MLAGGIQWWCSARGTPWSWEWQAYPGVWLFVALTGALVWAAARRGNAVGGPRGNGAPHRAAGIGAVLLVWLMLDWPLGPLAAGYLASVHALQFIALAMVVPPLLLVAVRGVLPSGDHDLRPRLDSLVRIVTHPLIAIVLFSVVMGVTHTPVVVDGLMRSQAGAFALDLAWLLSGLLFWWPVIVPWPERPRFVTPLRMLYLFFGTQGHLLIAMWLLVSEFPVYATYELAPRVSRLTAIRDQQVAGAAMLALAGPLVLGVISVMFFRWAARMEAAESAGGDSRSLS